MELGSALQGTRTAALEAAREQERAAEEGGDVRLLLQLPDGSQHAASFKAGTTVAYVKLRVQQDHGLQRPVQVRAAASSVAAAAAERAGILSWATCAACH